MAKRQSSSFKFLTASFSGSALTLTRLLTGFLRSKYLAIVLGTTGVGVLAQSTQFQLLGVTLGSLAMSVGIINRLSLASDGLSAEENELRRQRLLSTAFTSQFVVSIGFVLVGLVFAQPFSRMIFGSDDHLFHYLIVLLGIPFSVLASGYVEGILFGSNRYGLYIKASIAATIVGFLGYIPMVYFFGLTGAFFGVSFSSLVLGVFFVVYVAQIRPLSQVFRFGFDREEFRSLVKFCTVMFLNGLAGYGGIIWMRGELIAHLGPHSNGILQVPIALTAYYTPFLTNPLWGRLHPFVSKHGDSPQSRKELSIVLRIVIFVCACILVWAMLLQEYFVRVAYSTEFLPALDIIPFQLVGDFFYFIAFTFGVYLLGAASLKAYLAGWLTYYIAFPVVSVFLLDRLGLYALPTGYLACTAVAAAVSLGWYFTSVRNERRMNTLIVATVSLLAVLAQAALCYSSYPMSVRVVIPLIMAIVFLVLANKIIVRRSAEP